MKRLFLTILLAFPGVLCAQQRTYTLTEVNRSAKAGHLSANEFERIMERALQGNYPSRAENCTVTVRLTARTGGECFKFTWSCDVIPSAPAVADYHFTRRGTILPGNSLQAAEENVAQELSKSGKVNHVVAAFTRDYGIVKRQDVQSFPGSDKKGQYWYLKETFITANK
jgi:hypothetical protein